MLKKYKLQNYYYTLVVVGYALQVFLSGMKPGVLATLLMLLILFQTCINEARYYKAESGGIKAFFKNVTLVDAVVSAYFIYNIFSVIWLTKYGLPVSVFAGEFVCSVLPVIFYFAAIIHDGNRDRFYKGFAIGFLILGIVSLVLYVWAPQFYCDYLFRMNYISKADASTTRVRMESVTGSTCFSYLSIVGMIVAAYSAVEVISKDINDKSRKREMISAIAFLVFCIALVFLANSRAGMVTALLLIAYLNVLLVFTFKVIDKKYFYGEIAVAVIAILGLCIATPGAVSKIAARLISLPGAVGQRSEQWVAAMNNMHGAWLGNGLGANGHRALYISENVHVVADGGLVKLFCEEGCIGFGLFIYILAVLIAKGIKNLKLCYTEIAIIVSILLMSIGANVIAFQLCTPLMWYAFGAISIRTRNNKDLFSYSIKNRCKGEEK